MGRQWGVGFIATLMILIIVGIWITPLGALLGGLVLISAASAAALFAHVVFVKERTALVICSRHDDSVIRVIPGPDRTFLQPFVEKCGPVLDTGFHMEEVHVEDILQPDQRPNILGFTAYIVYQLEPHTISPRVVGTFLPQLDDNAKALVRHSGAYCLRNVVADSDLTQLNNGHRQHLERSMKHALRAQVARLGVRIQNVQLAIRPPVGLHRTLTAAEQQRVGITLQAEQLAALLRALTQQSEEASSLALLELSRSLGRDGQTWTGLDLSALLGTQPGRTSDPAGVQPLLWTSLLRPRPPA